MTSENLKRELDYFKVNQKEFVEKYGGKFLVIKDQKIQEAYDSEIDAYTDAKSKFELGTFLIQQCLPGEGSYTQTLHSRVMM